MQPARIATSRSTMIVLRILIAATALLGCVAAMSHLDMSTELQPFIIWLLSGIGAMAAATAGWWIGLALKKKGR